MNTANPLLVSLDETAFQLSISKEEVAQLIRDHDLTAVQVLDKALVTYDSIVAFTRRVKRNSNVAQVTGKLAGAR